jgi:hypothetical protein
MLKKSLADNEIPSDGRPSIPVQASFEGVVFAAIAAVDQVAQAVNSALKLGLAPGELFEEASKAIEASLPEFRAWREQPIGIDLRRIRTRMAHYSYRKVPAKGLIWEVETANEGFNGSRELSAYAEAAVSYSREMEKLLGSLEEVLARRTQAASPTSNS